MVKAYFLCRRMGKRHARLYKDLYETAEQKLFEEVAVSGRSNKNMIPRSRNGHTEQLFKTDPVAAFMRMKRRPYEKRTAEAGLQSSTSH